MGYFQVRYNSRVINYDRRGFIRLATESYVLVIFTTPRNVIYDDGVFIRLATEAYFTIRLYKNGPKVDGKYFYIPKMKGKRGPEQARRKIPI